MSPTAPPAPDRWIYVGLLLLLVWLPLPWGSRPEPAVALFGFAAALLAALRLAVARDVPLRKLPRAARVALALWLAWLGWITFQLIPLPEGLLGVLSPSALEIHRQAAAATEAPAMSTLSILPGATFDRLLLSASYLCLFWLVLVTVARDRVRQRLLLTVVVYSGLAQAVFGIVMVLSGWEYGFFDIKQNNRGLVTGTFVNRNHVAGYLELALTAGIGLVLADLRGNEARSWRERFAAMIDLALSAKMRFRILLVIMVIALVMTRSRGGNLAFFSVLAFCGSAYLLLRHRQRFLGGLIFFVSMFAVDLMIVSEHYGLSQLTQRIETTQVESEQRTQVFAELGPVLRDYALTGSGLGTFAAAYLPVRSEQIRRHFTHAHNDHLEFLIETGIIGYGLLVLLALLVITHGVRVLWRRRDPAAGALGFVGPMAIGCMAVHGLSDFNLQMPAVAATFVALLAASLSCSSDPRAARQSDRELPVADLPPAAPCEQPWRK